MRSAFADWAGKQEPAIAALFEQYRTLSQSYSSHTLTGPTGERNSYTLLPREHVLNLADERSDLLAQLAATLAVGSRAIWLESQRALHAELPKEVQKHIQLVADWNSVDVELDAILHHGDLTSCARSASRRRSAKAPSSVYTA